MLPFLKSRKSENRPRLPDGLRVYAISDIHGCAHLLKQMLRVIDVDMARSPPSRAIEVYLGDYIDRGPDSRATLDILIERSRRSRAVFLSGNHEVLLIEALRDPTRAQEWFRYGGLQTLISYGLTPSRSPDNAEQQTLLHELLTVMPEQHIQFLDSLRLTFTCGDFFFAHAGVRPGIPLDRQSEADLLWIRNEFLQSNENFGKYIIHGHTPVRSAEAHPNRMNIDTGAYATGNLTLLTIQGSRILAF